MPHGRRYLIDSEPRKFFGFIFFIVCFESFFFLYCFQLLLALLHNNWHQELRFFRSIVVRVGVTLSAPMTCDWDDIRCMGNVYVCVCDVLDMLVWEMRRLYVMFGAGNSDSS